MPHVSLLSPALCHRFCCTLTTCRVGEATLRISWRGMQFHVPCGAEGPLRTLTSHIAAAWLAELPDRVATWQVIMFFCAAMCMHVWYFETFEYLTLRWLDTAVRRLPWAGWFVWFSPCTAAQQGGRAFLAFLAF